jgi:hypothetical protein
MDHINVLVSLNKGYGLGDAVQMSAVLRHVAALRPHWIVDYQAEEGRHQVGRGIVANTFAYGEDYPSDHYDAEVLILLYDTWANWGDRPNTRVSSCLHERFGLPWDRLYGRYQVNISDYAHQLASDVVGRKSVAIHYQGDSSPNKKNLTHDQAIEIRNVVLSLGRQSLFLDWRNEWPVCRSHLSRSIGGYSFSREWGASAEMNCAVIGQCDAFVGIDSGPSKCASATNTPALVVWTGHHPAPFHDPAPNTTHLVPVGYHGLFPVCDNQVVIEWFEENYNVRYYHDGNPIPEVRKWLVEVLR